MNSFRGRLVGIPIIGGLAYCSWRDFGQALQELGVKYGIASIPVFISTSILAFVGTHRIPPVSAFNRNFENGELYLFCTSMLSAIFYIALRERGEGKPGFPNKLAHIFFVLIMVLISSVIFALHRAGLVIDPVVLIKYSYCFFGLCLIMALLATTIHNGLGSNNALLFQKAETAGFLDQVNQRRG